MEFFTLDKDDLTRGTIIRDITEALWSEKYDVPGEFTFTFSPATMAKLDEVPIGTFVSHTGTKEVMIVETHQITEERGSPSKLEISGRGVTSFFENRVAIPDVLYRMPEQWGYDPFFLFGVKEMSEPNRAYEWWGTEDYPWNHAKTMLDIGVNGTLDLSEAIPEFAVYNSADTVSWDPGDEATYVKLERTDILTAVASLLSTFDGGIKTLRPIAYDDPNINIVIHRGNNLQDSIIFTMDQVSTATYLRSNIGYRNGAIIQGEYVGAESRPAEITGLDLRMAYEVQTDISYNPIPADAAAEIRAKDILNRRLKRLIRKSKKTRLFTVELTEANRYRYRYDYSIGDIVYFDGTFGRGPARVIEYVEGFNSDGVYGYPVLREFN